MLLEFKNHLEKNHPYLRGAKLLLAVSGGLDSMVLLHLCHQLELDCTIAHCNFQLRSSESNGDEDFVKSQAEQLNIPVFIQRFDTKEFARTTRSSIQVVARNLRYDWFTTLQVQENLDYILTAHHLDDSLETCIINLTRGTGIDGLMGIPEKNGTIVRPLLIFSREDIHHYALLNKIAWREDSSNSLDKYKRNRIRHHIIPLLKEQNSNLLQSFQATVQHLQQVKSLANDATNFMYQNIVQEEEDTIKIKLAPLLNSSNYQAYLYQLLSPYGFTAWEDIYNLVIAQSGKQVYSETHILLKNRNEFVLFPKQTTNEEVYFLVKKDQEAVKIPLKLSFSKVADINPNAINTIFVDENKLRYPLEIRKWKEGDMIFPSGMRGKKKLSKFFKDEKYSLLDKTSAWLLCSQDEIVWIIGKRQDERFKVNEQTNQILQIQLEP